MAEYSILISATVQDLLQLDNAFAAQEGFDLLVAADLPALLTLARERKPSVIFITPYDSATDGSTECCCHLAKNDPEIGEIPVIAIVDGKNKSHRLLCGQQKPDDILFTPLNTHLFLASARRVLGLPHRAFDRVQTSLRVEFGSERNALRPACAFNLSSGGIFIAVESKIDINSRIVVKLEIPQSDAPIFCESIVTWINTSINPQQPEIPAGIGLQFLSLNANDLFAIRSFINEYAQNS
ncbi:MAG: PilZ domain-containing protein [Desulfuromonadaceae bacterium]|nr:PilZ domain-containing protein [Desulfuromonas sp.]MDY0185480.1 PilZ domain-containing protein [Desulfuromonadaceae bacterium]